MRCFDIAVSLFFLLFTVPLMLVVSILIVITSGRPIFYVSRRIGKNGREFIHVKFRTMRAGKELGRVFFEQERITKIGRVLRALHVDELPEFFSVLSGKMAIVGPRPLPARLLSGLDAVTRAQVPPGLTCLAQVSLMRHGRLTKRLQVKLDNRFAAKRSFSYNVQILAATFSAFRNGKKPDLAPDATADRRRFLKADFRT